MFKREIILILCMYIRSCLYYEIKETRNNNDHIFIGIMCFLFFFSNISRRHRHRARHVLDKVYGVEYIYII